MRMACPSCGALHEWDSLVQHDYARKALTAAFALPPALQAHISRYLRLFVSSGAPQRVLLPDRYATLLTALASDISKGAIEARGRMWSAPLPSWAPAFEAVFAAVDAGRRKLPLRDHSYLYGVLVHMADQAEGSEEKATEQTRRSRVLNAASDCATLTEQIPVNRNPREEQQSARPVGAPRGIPAETAERLARFSSRHRMNTGQAGKEAPAHETSSDAVLTGAALPLPTGGSQNDLPPAVDRQHPLFGAAVLIKHGRFKGIIGRLQRVAGTRVTVSITRPRAGESTHDFALEDVEVNP